MPKRKVIWHSYQEIEIEINDEEPVYTIEVVCLIIGLPYWTLRHFLKEGIVRPKKVGKKKMLFCMNDLRRIEYAKHLMEEKGININGIKFILENE